MAKLGDKNARFVQEYLKDLNATEAAKRAGYSEASAHVQGCRLLKNAKILEHINKGMQARAARTEITSDRVLKELFRLATVDISDAFDDKGCLKELKDIPEDIRRAMSALEVQEIAKVGDESAAIVGVVKKVRFADKIKALELLGKHLKLFTEKHEHSGPDGKPIELKHLRGLSEAQLDARLAQLEAKEEG